MKRTLAESANTSKKHIEYHAFLLTIGIFALFINLLFFNTIFLYFVSFIIIFAMILTILADDIDNKIAFGYTLGMLGILILTIFFSNPYYNIIGFILFIIGFWIITKQ